MPGNALTPSERTQRARLAANIGWAFTQDRSARTAPARRAAFAKFEKLVDPDGVLPVAERAVRNSVCGFHGVSSVISSLTMTRIRTVSQRGQYQQSNSVRQRSGWLRVLQAQQRLAVIASRASS